jgi:hypothetical protein
MSLLLAQLGHAAVVALCLLLGQSGKHMLASSFPAFDPNRTCLRVQKLPFLRELEYALRVGS